MVVHSSWLGGDGVVAMLLVRVGVRIRVKVMMVCLMMVVKGSSITP